MRLRLSIDPASAIDLPSRRLCAMTIEVHGDVDAGYGAMADEFRRNFADLPAPTHPDAAGRPEPTMSS